MRIATRLGMAALLAALLPAGAGAVVSGSEGGPAEGSVLMVLNARGGVCTGIVVAPRAVLTAGHCVADRSELRLHWRDGSGQPVLQPPATVALHPEFVREAVTERRRSIDLALVRLAEPLPGRFAPAALADRSLPRAGSAVTVAGYGVSREGEARSTGTYRSASLRAVEPYGPGRILVWAADPAGGGKQPGAGACEGDSGGPMLDSNGAIFAVTSWSTGPKGRRCGLLSQGVLLAPQRGWIDATLSGWGERARWTAGE